MQKLLTSAFVSKLLWLTRDGGANTEAPAYRLIDGVLRALNSETDSAAVTTLVLQDPNSSD
jgi:hypothetical protein